VVNVRVALYGCPWSGRRPVARLPAVPTPLDECADFATLLRWCRQRAGLASQAGRAVRPGRPHPEGPRARRTARPRRDSIRLLADALGSTAPPGSGSGASPPATRRAPGSRSCQLRRASCPPTSPTSSGAWSTWRSCARSSMERSQPPWWSCSAVSPAPARRRSPSTRGTSSARRSTTVTCSWISRARRRSPWRPSTYWPRSSALSVWTRATSRPTSAAASRCTEPARPLASSSFCSTTPPASRRCARCCPAARAAGRS